VIFFESVRISLPSFVGVVTTSMVFWVLVNLFFLLSDSDFEGFKRIILDDRPLCLSCGGGEGEQYKPTRTKNKVVSMIPGFTAKKYRNTCIQTTNQDVVHVVRLA
jgi:hypothetical protein